MNSLHLHIDRIVVDGLAEHEQRRFARTLHAHLEKFARSGIADHLAAGQRKIIPALAGTLTRGATAEQAAAQLVQSLRRGIAGPRGHQAPVAGKPSAGEARHHV